MKGIISWFKALFRMVNEYKQNSVTAVIRYKDGRLEELSIPRVLSAFELPKVCAKVVKEGEWPEPVRLMRFVLRHVSRDGRFAIYEPQEDRADG